MHTTAGLGGQIFTEAGLVSAPGVLTLAEAQKVDSGSWNYNISLERLEDLRADYIFVLPGWEDEISTDVLESALWKSSPALTESNVIYIQRTARPFVGEYLPNAHVLIDIAYDKVLGVDPSVEDPNPFEDWLGDAKF